MTQILLNSNFQWVLISTMILGIASGTVGCLSYWRSQSLLSDSLAHSAFPGVVIAYYITGEKKLFVLIFCAAISALIGALFIEAVRSYSRITEDAAMGMALSLFFGLGIMLLTMVNRTVGGNQSGLDSFIFGQAAAMVRSDVYTMLILALIVSSIILFAFKEWKIFLFDSSFAKGMGLSPAFMKGLYTLLLVTTIVIGIQAVGVILIAALLIIPPVSARYWTHSFRNMIILSAFFGGISGMMGTFISAFGKGWPTGPFIVIMAAAIFLASFVFGKEQGILIKYLRVKMQQKRMETERVPAYVHTKGAE